MSIELTFRQKFTRIAASAAISGLSISFITGEAVDQQAKLLRQWTVDSALVPADYLPMRPLRAAANEWSVDHIIGQLVAVNSAMPQNVADAKAIRNEFVKTEMAFDTLSVARAAPALATAPVTKVAPEPVRRVGREMSQHELETVLMKIHDVTSEIAGATSSPLEKSNLAVKQESTDKKIPASPTPSFVPVAPPQEMILAANQNRNIAGAWQLQGKFTNTNILKEAGHFEVGLFSKIDSEGVPIGYPVAQQILPAGKVAFALPVPPKVSSGFLFGEFVSAKTGKRFWIAPPVNPWLAGERQFAELSLQIEDVASVTAAAPVATAAVAMEETQVVRGTVTTMFAKGKPINQPDVVVKVRGRREAARTDKNGVFSLSVPRARGTIYLEFLKAGYHPAIVPVPAGMANEIDVQLASREAIDRLASLMGTHQLSTKGVFIGKAAQADGAGLKGMTVSMSLRAEGPYYFTEEGFPAVGRKSTSSDGRFLFFNIEPGAGYVESSVNGESIVPFPIASVEGGELNIKTLVPTTGSLKGRLFNPVIKTGALAAVAGARVRLEGSIEWTSTDAFGAFSLGSLKWIKGESVVMEFSAEKFNNHRYAIDLSKQKDPVSLFAFPASYIRRLAHSMDVDLDPYAGIVFGKAVGPSMRMDALADHSNVNGAKDFYFDGQGRLKGSHTMTDPRYGTYVIFNVPKGRSMLQGSDGNGRLRYADSVVVNPSTVTIIMD